MECAECGSYRSDVELMECGRHQYCVRCRSCGWTSRKEGTKAWAVRSWNRDQREYLEG